jgi:hypothetical protein
MVTAGAVTRRVGPAAIRPALRELTGTPPAAAARDGGPVINAAEKAAAAIKARDSEVQARPFWP